MLPEQMRQEIRKGPGPPGHPCWADLQLDGVLRGARDYQSGSSSLPDLQEFGRFLMTPEYLADARDVRKKLEGLLFLRQRIVQTGGVSKRWHGTNSPILLATCMVGLHHR